MGTKSFRVPASASSLREKNRALRDPQPEEVLRDADIALKRKDAGDTNVFDETMHAHAVSMLRLRSAKSGLLALIIEGVDA